MAEITDEALTGPGLSPLFARGLIRQWRAEATSWRHFAAGEQDAERRVGWLTRAEAYDTCAEVVERELSSADPAERDAEMAKLRSGARSLGKTVVHMSRSMRAAQIEMAQNGPAAGMQWILNSLPDVDDNPEDQHWDGKESATEWLDRTEDAARALAPGAEPAADGLAGAVATSESPEAQPGAEARSEDAIRYDERRRVLDAARPITVLMTRADGSQVAAVQWSALLEALGLKP